MKQRIQKILSQSGISSRRKAEEFILSKRVKLNGVIAKIGDLADENDEIMVDNVPIVKNEEKIYIMLNKPKKVISTVKDPQKRTTVVDLINLNEKIFPIGRLDYDTTGTLLLTNDGEMSHRLVHPSFEIKRVYRARLNETLTEEQLLFLNSNNVKIDGKKSLQKVELAENKTYLITLNVGTYHHIKKLFELVDRKVLSLTRIEFAGLSHVNDLSVGQWRFLKIHEIKWLKTLTNIK